MSDDFGKRRVTIRLTEKLLGTAPRNKNVYGKYIAAKKLEMDDDMFHEETQTIEEVEDKGWTGFHKDENGLFLFDYLIKGFLKSGFEVSMEMCAIDKVVAYKKWIDLLVFVWPRRIYYIDEGREISFVVEVLKNKKNLAWDSVEQAFDYGRYVGLGQWRGSGGFGRFDLVDVAEAE